MKRFLLILATAVGFVPFATAQNPGPLVDQVIFNAKSQEDLGLLDVASGKSDLWNYGTPGAVYERLPADRKAKLDVYAVSGASFLGLMVNPFPNQAPYLSDAATDASGKAQFNPLAIQRVRYALNWLINRQKVVDEILGGIGIPQFTPVVPGLPNSSRFDGIAAKLGITATGNEARALAEIGAAVSQAAGLPELQGRLVKTGPWWTFDGEPVTLRFIIRADDPNVRVPLGRYVADQLEKAGLKVERLEWDRVKAPATVNRTDPKTLQWSLYTEGLGSNETRAYWEMKMSYMYAPWASIMPGGNNPDYWNYRHPELDRLTKAVVNGQVKDADDYWTQLLAATSLGMQESVRILVAAKTSYQVAAKDRFAARMAYGLGNGLDKWSLYTADVKAETSGSDRGQKVLRMTGFSSRGALFMNAWDPVGAQGFGDTYSGAVITPASDLEYETHPATGLPMAVRATARSVKTGNDPLEVSSGAVLWDQSRQKWITASGAAFSQVTYQFRYGAWHHGRAVDQNDYRYAIAFPSSIASPAYVSAMKGKLALAKGYEFAKDGTITVWSDARFPVDSAQLAATIAPALHVGATASGSVVPWEILEGLSALVNQRGPSGILWSFGSDANAQAVDLINPQLVGDLQVQLDRFIAEGHVPAALRGFVTPAQAIQDYRLTKTWLAAHGHGYISNGGFYLDRYDAGNNTGVLKAFRDKRYPFAAGSWTTTLRTEFSRVDAVTVGEPVAGRDLKVTVAVSQVSYPSQRVVPAAQAQVTVSLIAGDQPLLTVARKNASGRYEATFPARTIDALAVGGYTVVAEASLGQGDAPAVASSLLLKF